MSTKTVQESKPEVDVNSTTKNSTPQSSAEEQKNNLQNKNTTEENKNLVPDKLKDDTTLAPIKASMLTPAEIITAEKDRVIDWLDNSSPNASLLKGTIDLLDSGIELRLGILSTERQKSKRVPGVDKRIETIEFFDESIEPIARRLSENNQIKLETELINLREKRYLVWQQFIRVVGSEKKALKYEKLRSQAKSKFWHSKSSYHVKQKIQKIFNSIINDNKEAMIQVRQLADNSTENGIKIFNESIRELIYEYDDDLIIQCSHVNRDLYFSIMRLTLIKWDPETDSEITELVEPVESKQ